jgi:hypothetical protein
LIGRRFAASRLRRTPDARSARRRKSDDVGLAFVRDHGIEHPLDRRKVAEAGTMRAGLGVADRTTQVAVVGDLDQRQAAVLHVLGAQTTVIRAAPALLGVEALRQFRRLDEDFARLAVVRRVVGDQHALAAVLRAPLFEEYALVLDQDLRFDAAQARRAHRHGAVVEQVRP